ncbi:MFS transporter [Ectobacillus panaciterrae]|uniref:MFS transporter n=1 Tax=Ectobacillus panaciterrae TaxID=363872 RepID=UPI0004261A27|nr:MFS transporter [Ectobacillus panaciterrae]
MKTKLWTKDFINVSGSSFFLFLTFYALLVTLPIYALQSLHGRESEAGLIVTVFLISAIISRPLTGQWIQRFGKRPVLITSLLIFGAACAFYFIPNSMTGLLVLRFFHGIGFGMATTATGTIVADIIPDFRRGEGMGYYAMSMNLAMVIGPFLGLTIFRQWGIHMVFTISTCCALFALIMGLFIHLPKIEQLKNKPAVKDAQLQSLFEISAIRISLTAALFGLVYASILSFVSIYAKEIGLAAAASYFFVIYAFVLLLSRPFTGRWFDIYGANRIIYPAIVCFACGMFLLSAAKTAPSFLTAAALIGLGWGTLFPSFQTLAIQAAPPARRGLATATFLSIFDLGIGIGSFIVGLTVVKVGFSSLYFYCSILVLLGIGVYYALNKKAAVASIKETKQSA